MFASSVTRRPWLLVFAPAFLSNYACSSSDDGPSPNGGASALAGSNASAGAAVAGQGDAGGGVGGQAGASANAGANVGGAGTAGSGSGGVAGAQNVAGADSGPATLVLPIERAGNYVLEFEDTLFEVSATGGQIVTFSIGGKNILWPSASAIAACPSCFGSTLWTSPQSAWGFPPPPVIDSGPYTATVSGNSITMVSAVSNSPGPKVSFTKKFTPNLAARAIDIEYTVKNESDAVVSLAPWEVTRVAAGGLSFFPIVGAPYANGMLVPTLVAGGIVWVDLATNPPGNNKVFADGNKSYIAHTDGTYLFVKSWSDVPAAAHATNEGEVEYYDGDTYVELENQGAYEPVAAGQTTTLSVRWAVRKLQPGQDRVAGDPELTAAAQALSK